METKKMKISQHFLITLILLSYTGLNVAAEKKQEKEEASPNLDKMVYDPFSKKEIALRKLIGKKVFKSNKAGFEATREHDMEAGKHGFYIAPELKVNDLVLVPRSDGSLSYGVVNEIIKNELNRPTAYKVIVELKYDAYGDLGYLDKQVGGGLIYSYQPNLGKAKPVAPGGL
jgi:hypothetical protein